MMASDIIHSPLDITQPDTRRIYCVVLKGFECLSDVQLGQLNKVYNDLKEHGAKVAHLYVNKVMELDKRLPGFSFIIPEFEGDLYKHLLKMNSRIYGPMALIDSLKKFGKIPRYPKPLFALSCINFVVSATGLSLDERKNLFQTVGALGGVCSAEMTRKTTHLFCKECDPKSLKYRMAAEWKVALVSPEWIYSVFKAVKEGAVAENIPMSEFEICMFTSCTMTTSGIDLNERKRLAELVKENGGLLIGELRQNLCTHLIMDSPFRNSSFSSKYRKALEWGTLKIVTIQWITDSIKMGVRLDEEDYKLKTLGDPMKPANGNSGAGNFIGWKPQPSLESNVSSSSLSYLHPPNISHIFKTPQKENDSKQDLNVSSVKELMKKPVKHSSLTRDPIMDLDISSFEDRYDEYLNDYRLYFYGFANDQIRSYRKLANCTGCIIVDSISSATHIIVAAIDLTTNQLNFLKDASSRDIQVLQCHWLIDCVKMQSNIDIDAYQIFTNVQHDDLNEKVGSQMPTMNTKPVSIHTSTLGISNQNHQLKTSTKSLDPEQLEQQGKDIDNDLHGSDLSVMTSSFDGPKIERNGGQLKPNIVNVQSQLANRSTNDIPVEDDPSNGMQRLSSNKGFDVKNDNVKNDKVLDTKTGVHKEYQIVATKSECHLNAVKSTSFYSNRNYNDLWPECPSTQSTQSSQLPEVIAVTQSRKRKSEDDEGGAIGNPLNSQKKLYKGGEDIESSEIMKQDSHDE